MALLFFKYFYFPSNNFTFLQGFLLSCDFLIFLLSFNIHSNIFCFLSNIFYCFPSNIFLFLSFKYVFALLQILLFPFKYFYFFSFKYFFCFISNILFAFLQRFLHYFIFYCFPLKLLSLLSFFNKIGMTKSYQLENQSI